MNKKTILSTTLALSLGFGGVYTAAPLSTSAAEVGVVFDVSADVTVQQNLVNNFEDIKALFSAETVDFAAVKAAYQEDFQAAVQARNPKIDEEISIIIEGGVNGAATAGQVKQAVDKGLQWFFHEEISALLKKDAATALKAGDKALAQEKLDQAIALFEGTLYVTAGKRDNDNKAYGVVMQDQFANIIVPGLQAAVEAGNVTEFQVFRQYFEKTNMKIFVLATAKYGATVEKDHANGDVDKEKAHLAEGYFFFMPVYGSLSSGSKEAADFIKNAFSQPDGSQMKGDEIKEALSRAINGKISTYANRVINTNLPDGDMAKAKEYTAEGNTFVSQLEVFVKQDLGEAAWNEILMHQSEYRKAVYADNALEANKHVAPILKTLSTMNGVNFKVGENTLQVNGEVRTKDQVTSYIEPSTSRTLVSARFVADAIGVAPSDITWDAATQKVTITKNGKTLEFTIGSEEVLVNGVKAENSLDQAAVITNGRTYIPVRAVAELFNSKVFYAHATKEVIINY